METPSTLQKVLIVICIAAAAMSQSYGTNPQDRGNCKPRNVLSNRSVTYLDINNVRARIGVPGLIWKNDSSCFEVPKGNGTGTVYTSSFWIGGKTADSSVHLAAEMYLQGPFGGNPAENPDFYTGPVMDSSRYSAYQDSVWNYVWNLRKTDIEYHKAHYNDAGYVPIHDIQTWPGNGVVSYGQADRLAPFFDNNADGRYNPRDGDYPLIRGDQAAFYIFNDDRGPHLETTGKKMRVEIHGMAYAFDLPEDSAFNNTVFYNFKIINRSQNTYYNTYMGLFADFDIGWYTDDYMGCDVPRGSIIGYNGTTVDGSGQPGSYGDHPPAQSVTILAGPLMPPTGADRPRYDNTGHQLCNESVNGMYFGDGIPDNERLGMSYFLNFENSNTAAGYPLVAEAYYNYLHSVWRDSTNLLYGGNGRPEYGAYGPGCRFMFPGNSDTTNWGVGCQAPNGQTLWTESSVGNGPGDRRSEVSSGPFVFHPREAQDFDLGLVFARDYSSTDTSVSVDKLRDMIDIIRNSFATNTLPNGNPFMGANSNLNKASIYFQVFPNPVRDRLNVDFGTSLTGTATLRILNANGAAVGQTDVLAGTRTTSLNFSNLPEGLYLIQLSGNGMIATRKVCHVK
jgi:hypothetical protein